MPGDDERPPSAEETRRQRARVRGLESEILKLEKRLGAIDVELAEPQTYADRQGGRRSGRRAQRCRRAPAAALP